MARSRKFSIAEGEPPRLELSWRGIWKDIDVRLDGRTLGTIPDQRSLKQGREFSMPDGSTLRVQLKTGFGSAELLVLRNGHPLPGSGSDPAVKLKLAAGVVWFIAGLNILLGLITVLGQVEMLTNLGIGWANVAEGALYGILAHFTWRRSMIALAIAVGLFGLDTVFWLVTMVGSGARPGMGGVFMRIFLFMPMVQGFSAIKALKEQEAARRAAEKAF